MADEARTTGPKILNLEHYSLFTKAPGEGRTNSRLSWSVRAGNPRISVWTGIQNDNKPINAPMDPVTFFIFLRMFEAIAKNPAEDKAKIDCYFGGRADASGVIPEKVLVGELFFGKDENGICWISVQAPNRPKIKFDLNLSDYHKIYKAGNTPITSSEASTIYTLSMIQALRDTYITHCGYIRDPSNVETTNRPARPRPTNPALNGFAASSGIEGDDIPY